MVILASAEFAHRVVKMNDPQANSFLLKKTPFQTGAKQF